MIAARATNISVELGLIKLCKITKTFPGQGVSFKLKRQMVSAPVVGFVPTNWKACINICLLIPAPMNRLTPLPNPHLATT